MIGNNRHSDRTFVSEHICGRLAPSAGHADARLLARPPVFTLAASLSRSLSISFLLSFLAYLLSFSTPVFFSLAHPRPPYAVPSRSPLALVPLLPSPFPFVSARPPLLSRVVVPLSKPLFPPRYITTLPRLVRSSSNSLYPARRFATARIFAFFSLAPSIPSDAPSLSLFVPKPLSIFLSSSLPHLASLFPRPLFRSPRCFLSPTNAFSPDVYVSSGVWYAGRTSYKRAGAYVCTQAVLLALISRAAGRRACSNRFDTRSWGKKNGRMYRRRLSPRRVNTPRPRVRARATRALGQWRNFSRFFLLPFCIGPAFRIYLRVIRFAAGYNTRLASRRMDAAGVR